MKKTSLLALLCAGAALTASLSGCAAVSAEGGEGVKSVVTTAAETAATTTAAETEALQAAATTVAKIEAAVTTVAEPVSLQRYTPAGAQAVGTALETTGKVIGWNSNNNPAGDGETAWPKTPVVYALTTAEEWHAFSELATPGDMNGMVMAGAQYADAFFNNKAIVAVTVPYTSSSYEITATGLKKADNGALCVEFTTRMPKADSEGHYMVNADVVERVMLIEVAKSAVSGVTQFTYCETQTDR